MEFVATYLSGRPAGQQMFSEGFSQGISTLVPGKQYIVALQSKRINSYMASSTRAAHAEVEVSSTAPLPTNSLHQGGWARPSVNGSQNLLSFEPNTSGFMLYADCFYPDSAWSNIWLYTSNPDSLGSTIGSTVDDIEIIENSTPRDRRRRAAFKADSCVVREGNITLEQRGARVPSAQLAFQEF